MVSSETINDKLFYAAEAGLSKAVKRMRIMDLTQFTEPTAGDVAVISNLPDFEINDTRVDISASWNDSLFSWTLWATATDINTSKKCTVKLENIKSQAFTDKSLTMHDDMPYSVRLVGAKLIQGVYQPNDMMLGNLFFGGRINIERDPIFEGKVTSSSRSLSIRTNNNVTEYNETLNPNGLSSAQRTMSNSKYNNGIWDLTETSETIANMRDVRYPKVFPNDYVGASGFIDNTRDVVATFDEILDPATRPVTIKGEPYVVTIGPTTDLNVIIEDGWITVTPKPTGWSSSKVQFDNTKNAILFEGEKTAENRISIGSSTQESVINGDLTVMSRNVDIEIRNDIKYKELVAPYASAISSYPYPFTWAINSTSANGARNGDNITALAKQLKTDNALSKFGCISEQGNIWLGKELCQKKGSDNFEDIHGVTMLNGAFYAPNGKFGIRQPPIKVNGTTMDGLDPGAKKFGSIDNWYEGNNSTEVLTRIVVIGSAMMKKPGKFRQIKGEIDENSASTTTPILSRKLNPLRKQVSAAVPEEYHWEMRPPNPAKDKFGNPLPLVKTKVVDKPGIPAVWNPSYYLEPAQYDTTGWNVTGAGTQKYKHTRGFEGAFCNDYRFSENGMFPAVFKPLKTSDGFIYNNEVTRWSCTFSN